MITENRPGEHLILGNDIQEMLAFAIQNIRQKSQEFYRHQIEQDLRTGGKAIVDRHAGMGKYLIITLTP